MKKKVVILGGGTGMSSLLRGLKQFPIDITTIVSVCDDGKSTGRLREEFNTPAVGDIRKVMVSLSETEGIFGDLLNYRFNTTSDLNGHALGNLFLTALIDVTGNISDGIEAISKVLNLKGKVLPLTEDKVTLVGKMQDGTIIEGEHNITESKKIIDKVYYKNKPIICPSVIEEIKKADLVILSMGSLYTSILPNLICDEIINEFDNSKAKIMYVCNMMTQPGETDSFMVSDHIKILNQNLGNRKIDVIIANEGMVEENIRKKYETLESKEQVVLDKENINCELISDNYVTIENSMIRHDVDKIALAIYTYLINR